MTDPAPPEPRVQLFVFLFPGFEPLDADGPICFFGALPCIDIITVAQEPGPVTSATGRLTWVAAHGLQDAMRLQEEAKAHGGAMQSWLLVPGGLGTRQEVLKKPMLDDLKKLAQGSDRVMSVCTGAALLSAMGLLEGRRATTNKMAWQWATSQGPNPSATDWVRQARWVHDGSFSTAAGVSAGMDMALDIIKTVYGVERAAFAAKRAEYEAHEEADWDPFGAMALP